MNGHFYYMKIIASGPILIIHEIESIEKVFTTFAKLDRSGS